MSLIIPNKEKHAYAAFVERDLHMDPDWQAKYKIWAEAWEACLAWCDDHYLLRSKPENVQYIE